MEGDSSVFVESGYFHVCTDGTFLDWMFKDDADFIAGVNRAGICCHITGVSVFAFVLMDNHVHFLLYGPISSCKEFMDRYKNLTGKYISSRYGESQFLKDLPSKIIPVRGEERLLETIAYIYRNPLVAGYRFLPGEYRWGSARYLFREYTDYDSNVLGSTCSRGVVTTCPAYGCSPISGRFRELGSMPLREQRSLLGTHTVLPSSWVVDSSGMIDPRCFLEVGRVEQLFGTPTRYLYFLSRKLEGDIDRMVASGNNTFLRDKDLRVIVGQLASDIFGVESVRLLNVNQRLVMARKLKYEYASTAKQISRMLGLDLELLKGYV